MLRTVAAMPTQTDFDEAARALRATLVTLSTSRRHLHSAHAADAIVGGSIAPVVDAALTASQANVDRLAGEVESLAVLCDQRSRVCAEHVAALDRWRTRYARWEHDMSRWRSAIDPLVSMPWPGPAPARPTPPYSWVAPA